MMRKLLLSAILMSLALSVAWAQGNTRQWYRGAFDGWVDVKSSPAPGYYYRPSPDTAYPLFEQSYGQPIPCAKCGHQHWPGEERCAGCGCECLRGGNDEPSSTVYTPRRLPGMYFYKQQPHYRFTSPMRLGGFQKYTRPWD